ncbi:MAG: flagellar assembly peptidoglycan hydrolase FlgJ [Rubrivivax sp.]|nr:flagellar assembly peptidoglycan hydrolase FlgJ [Rubrivivax sp.]
MAVHDSAGATRLAADTQSLAGLRARAAGDPRSAVREAARQFEALFMNELVKSMRATTMQSQDDAQSQLATGMLDTQFANQLAGMPGGLSEAIARQLERQMGLAPGPIPATGSANDSPAPLAGRPTRLPQGGAAAFVQQHDAAARQAEAATGIPAAFMIGQAAHESGWGRRDIRAADGTPSHNLFGIKAGAGWKGAVVEAATTEVVDGRPVRTVARFRAYASAAESFADYARLMQGSPRYREVLAQGHDAAGFAGALQRAGYATDPDYAAKLTRVINTTLRLQRATG